MVGPPGDPKVSTGSLSLKTMVGLLQLTGRFPASAWFSPPGIASKSVSSLLSKIHGL